MTLEEARAIIANKAAHDDAQIRDAAAVLIREGTAEEKQAAQRLAKFGLKHDAAVQKPTGSRRMK